MFIKDGLCHITFPDGKMTLVMDKFFPAPQPIIRKLFLKTIALNWKDRCQITAEILDWLGWQLAGSNPDERKKYHANKYAEIRTQITELEEQIEKQTCKINDLVEFRKTLPPRSGHKQEWNTAFKAEQGKLKDLKDKRRDLKADAADQMKQFNKIDSDMKKFKANIELIEQLTADWR